MAIKRPPKAAGQSRKRYCEIRANNLEEILATCERHIQNIGLTQLDLIQEGDGDASDDFYINMFRGAWQDMRDDVNELLEAQKNKPAMPPTGWALTGLLPAVHIVECTEHEFGQRPCGFTAHKTESDAKAYMRMSESEDKKTATPGQYFSYSYIGVRECSYHFQQKLGAARGGIVGFNELAELKGP